MHGKIQFTLKGERLSLWFNNFSKIELGKTLLPSVNGYPAKPEEIELLNEIQRRADDNHLRLLLDVVYAGLIGHHYAVDTPVPYTRADLGGMIAEAKDEELYAVWRAFLEAMGLNLDEIAKENSKKKAKVRKARKV